MFIASQDRRLRNHGQPQNVDRRAPHAQAQGQNLPPSKMMGQAAADNYRMRIAAPWHLGIGVEGWILPLANMMVQADADNHETWTAAPHVHLCWDRAQR